MTRGDKTFISTAISVGLAAWPVIIGVALGAAVVVVPIAVAATAGITAATYYFATDDKNDKTE